MFITLNTRLICKLYWIWVYKALLHMSVPLVLKISLWNNHYRLFLLGLLKQWDGISIKQSHGFLFFFYCFSSTVVSIFFPLHSPCPTHPHLPPLILPPLALSICPLYMFLDDPSPIFPHYHPPPSHPLVTVSLFFISMSLVLFYLLVSFVD